MSYKYLIELQGIKGAKAKQAYIKEHENIEGFKRLLRFALDPLITYNLSEKTLTEGEDANDELVMFKDIFECCDYLSGLRAMDGATLRQVRSLLHKCSTDERNLYIKLLSKTLRLGVTAKSINSVIPNLIPVWEVQQAFPIEKYPVSDGTEFWLTQKLNGTRATFYDRKLRARSGAAYSGLEHIERELAFLNVAGFVADGELTLLDKGNLSDNEAFREATGIINSDAESKLEICYTIFDVIPVKDFETEEFNIKYSIRRSVMDKLDEFLKSKDAQYVSVLPVLYHGKDQEQIPILLDRMVAEDKEGLMLNLDVPYRRTRHKGILKIKRFYTMDLPILRCEEGTGRLEGTLGSFVVDFEGNELNVGTGFSDEQRTEYWGNRENLVGSLCEVKYKEVSSDKSTGAKSLQFPVFVRLREDKTEVSYG